MATRCGRSARRSSGSTGTPRGTASSRAPTWRRRRARSGAPSVGIRRSDLLGVLLDAVGEDAIRFGRDARDEPRSADVVVGADGLHSTLRRELHGADELRAPGLLVCQGAVARVPSIPPAVFVEVWAPGLRFGCYPFRDGLNWFAFVREAEAEELAHDPHGFLLERTRDWTAPGHEVIAATPPDAVTWADVVAREPLERWTDGRVALLGDSAHAMTPFTGQGACQAIEDAVVLADCLRDEPDVPGALRAYEARRLPRAVEIWNRSWAAAASVAKKSRTVDPARQQAFAARFERVVWAQLEQTIVRGF